MQLVEHRFKGTQLHIKSLHLPSCIVWILPSDERDKLGRKINPKLVLILLVAMRTFFPWIPEFTCITSLHTFGFCICSETGEVNKSGICATTSTITSQLLIISFIAPSIKAQVAHRFPPVITRG
jgi:hypothetical protein